MEGGDDLVAADSNPPRSPCTSLLENDEPLRRRFAPLRRIGIRRHEERIAPAAAPGRSSPLAFRLSPWFPGEGPTARPCSARSAWEPKTTIASN